jgi:hypothetical protein
MGGSFSGETKGGSIIEWLAPEASPTEPSPPSSYDGQVFDNLAPQMT